MRTPLLYKPQGLEMKQLFKYKKKTIQINQDLKTILEWVRPNHSQSEESFCVWLHERIRDLGYQPKVDEYGNIWVMNGAKTLFTAHTDTVAYPTTSDVRHLTQDIVVSSDGIISLDSPQTGSVLGADDGAGIAMLLELMKAKVHADFVFFREEEIGGRGSDWAADDYAQHLTSYDRAIAFDRRDRTSVITHQGMGRCCSDTFAKALAEQLGMGYKLDDGGVFTDTANFTHLIPECTNLSVGYFNEHRSHETLDYPHWQALRDKVIQIDWDSLPTCRDVNEFDDFPFENDYGSVSATQLYDALKELKMYGLTAAQDLVYEQPELAAEVLNYLLENGGF